MIDSLIQNQKKAEESDIHNKLKIKAKEYALITLHRPSNVDTVDGLRVLITAFAEISKTTKLVFPVHPRTLKNIDKFDLKSQIDKIDNLILCEPVGYLDFMKLQMDAKFILTDSGGLQEESTYLNIPCFTLRENTERPITITMGTNQLVNQSSEDIVSKAKEALLGKVKKGQIPPLWDGKTSERIVKIFIEKCS
jgi:UDP-N-acetylglucosamine 2-epimerase (non-hydrolysing)